MNDHQLFWFAGLLEGEGCFDIQRNKLVGGAIKKYPRIQINMNDRDVLERVLEFTGCGSLNGPYGEGRGGNPKVKGYYSWKANSKHAVALMTAVRPLLGVRRQRRIDEVLQECR